MQLSHAGEQCRRPGFAKVKHELLSHWLVCDIYQTKPVSQKCVKWLPALSWKNGQITKKSLPSVLPAFYLIVISTDCNIRDFEVFLATCVYFCKTRWSRREEWERKRVAAIRVKTREWWWEKKTKLEEEKGFVRGRKGTKQCSWPTQFTLPSVVYPLHECMWVIVSVFISSAAWYIRASWFFVFFVVRNHSRASVWGYKEKERRESAYFCAIFVFMNLCGCYRKGVCVRLCQSLVSRDLTRQVAFLALTALTSLLFLVSSTWMANDWATW